MRSILRTACLTAVPVEALNFWVVGYPAGEHTLSSASQNAAIALQWYVLHLPGIIVLDHSPSLRPLGWACSVVLLAFGFLDTAALIAFLLWVVRFIKSRVRRVSSPKKTVVESEEPRSTRLSA